MSELDQVWQDTPHDVLSADEKQEKSLLAHLQHMELENPAAFLLPVEAESLLSNVIIEPAESEAAPDNGIAEPPPELVTLQSGVPLSKSLLWDMQIAYYSNMGIKAWEHNVPCFVTSSTYIAEAYAEMILAFLDDYAAHIDMDATFYIVEMATGTGRFSHLLIRELERKLSCFPAWQNLSWKYIMTDFTDSNPLYWEQHEKLKPFVDKGLLDFGVFNPLEQSEITLRISGEVVAADTVKNPVVAIANYFFDSVPHDVFWVESKTLHESLVTIERNIAGIDEKEPPHIREITTSYVHKPLRSDQYYENTQWNAILKFYKHHIKSGSMIFPLGAMQVIENLEKLSNKQLVLLSSDKAYSCLEHMTMYEHQNYAIHDGAFSFMVNYDAIGKYFENAGGKFIRTKAHNLSLHTVCCIRVPQAECRFDHLDYLYAEKIERTHAITSLCAILPETLPRPSVFQINQILSQFRLHLGDTKIFCLLAEQLIELLPHATLGQKQDLAALLKTGWENYYFFPGETNLPFWFSQLYYYIDMFEESVECLEKTMTWFGEHPALYYLKAQSHEKLKQWSKARWHYEKAIELDPENQEAIDALAALNAR